MNLEIIIPVFNALEDLKECIESVRNSDIQGARLTIVDDCSTDPQVKPFLEDFATQSFPMPVEILYNPVNVGFIKTCNRGMKASEWDVVLLNSDAILTKNTLAEMQKTAYLEERIGTVTPLSNNATILSVPGMGVENHYPEEIDLEGIANVIQDNSLPAVFEIPTAIGFCMYIK
ncbi:MAG: glycosyltransferase, partial [Cyanobacteria bacterium]|nr:glycosyltransferase [Cyanobacteriota bacterium]